MEKCCNGSNKNLTYSPEENSYDWSRLCPMGQLLEPKLYPVNLKIPSEIKNHNEIKSYEEANIFLKNLKKKYFSPEKKLLEVDALRRINEDRYKSTYQIAYGHNIDYGCLDYADIDLPDKLPWKHDEKEEFKPCQKSLRPPYIGGHDVPGIRYDRSSILNDSPGDNKKSNKNQEESNTMKTSRSGGGKGSKGSKSSGTGGGKSSGPNGTKSNGGKSTNSGSKTSKNSKVQK